MADLFQIDGQKLHLHPQRVSQWLTDPFNTFPIYVEVSPVGYCNHRCTFCAVDYIGYKMRRLEEVELFKLVKEMAACGVKSIMWAGEGEPLLHPKLASVINYAKSIGIDNAITTNGVALTKQFVDSCIDSISWIKVSMNGGQQTYQRIHKAKDGDYERVWKNLNYAIEKRQKDKTVIGIQCLLLPENCHELHSLARQGQLYGLDYLVVKPYSQHKFSVTEEYKDVRYKEYDMLLDELSIYNNSGFEVVVRKKSMGDWDSQIHKYSKCYSTPTFWAYIMASGDVYGCSAYLEDQRFNYGNIKQQSFRDIWLSEQRKKSLEFVSTELDIKDCRLNCRMNKCNQYLWELKNNDTKHKNFI